MGFRLFNLLVSTLILVFVLISSGEINLTKWLIIDNVSLYLVLITCVFFLVYSSLVANNTSFLESSCLLISVVSSVVCFTSSHSVIFWFSYEITILPLLFLLFASSPYSERFLAGWYLITYIICTSLPMLLILIYISMQNGTFFFSCWHNVSILHQAGLFMLFITKVPLPPFHSWLPVVHAEASTFVSVVLSGYVMKLGIIGVCRFSSDLLTYCSGMLVVVFSFSILFFAVSFNELDNKRWLAFLSLSHILVAILALVNSDLDFSVSVLYCLGHGMSAGLLFYLFSVCYNISGTRNWVILSNSASLSNLWRTLLVLSMLTVCSFPPSISFLSEVLVMELGTVSINVMLLLAVYVFLGGLIPALLLSYILSSNSNSSLRSYLDICSISSIISLLFIWFFYILLM